MAKLDQPYRNVLVESFVPARSAARHGSVHIRPVAGQGLDTGLFVECSKRLAADYPVGTKFRIKAKLTDREDGGEYLYSYHGWKVEVIVDDKLGR